VRSGRVFPTLMERSMERKGKKKTSVTRVF
jgi:hypothetical protein